MKIDWQAIHFDRKGLVPAVVQEQGSGRVLMLGYMNRRSIQATIKTGYVHFYSRSRHALWKKGETSGHVQKLVSLHLDCDGDTLLAIVQQKVAACHAGFHSCFYRVLNKQGTWKESEKKVFLPKERES